MKKMTGREIKALFDTDEKKVVVLEGKLAFYNRSVNPENEYGFILMIAGPLSSLLSADKIPEDQKSYDVVDIITLN